jgi:FtsZ-binding cell division protein ZapB
VQALQNENDDNNLIMIPGEGSWRHILLNTAMEDVDRDKSALFFLMRHATVGQDACPLHHMVVEAMKESAHAKELETLRDKVQSLQAKVESLQADNVSVRTENESLQQRLAACMQAENGATPASSSGKWRIWKRWRRVRLS